MVEEEAGEMVGNYKLDVKDTELDLERSQTDWGFKPEMVGLYVCFMC